LGLRVGHRQRERERERERELLHRYFLMVQRTFVFWQLRVRVKEGITSMTSSHRQLLLLERNMMIMAGSSNAWQLENWVHQMFVVFLSGLVFCFVFCSSPYLLCLSFASTWIKCLPYRMNDIAQNSKGCNWRCMEC
jgi:hypothetical protein